MKSKFCGKHLVFLIPLIGWSCGRDCSSDQAYDARFYITNQRTGKPYFDQNIDNPDSLRLYEKTSVNSLQPLTIDKRVDPKRGYTFGTIDLIEVPSLTLYLSFNKNDIDTLLLFNQITPAKKQCGLAKYVTTGSYNGRPLKPVASDSVNGLAVFELIK